MRLRPRLRVGTLLLGTDHSKPEVEKTFRASRQATPALPPPPNTARVPRSPIPADLATGDVVEPFALELTIPARPDGRYPIQYHQAFPPYEQPAQNALVIGLRAGAPFRLLSDGHLRFADADQDWPEGERVAVTIRGWSTRDTPHELSWLMDVDDRERDNFLLVPLAVGRPFEVLRDGQLVAHWPEV